MSNPTELPRGLCISQLSEFRAPSPASQWKYGICHLTCKCPCMWPVRATTRKHLALLHIKGNFKPMCPAPSRMTMRDHAARSSTASDGNWPRIYLANTSAPHSISAVPISSECQPFVVPETLNIFRHAWAAWPAVATRRIKSQCGTG